MRILVGALIVLALTFLGGFLAGRATLAPIRAHAASKRVVPLRVQRLLKTRAPEVAYVPTRLPNGFRYDHWENLSRLGFDLYFSWSCCKSYSPLIGFDALVVLPGGLCSHGAPMKTFRIDGVLVPWNAGGNDQQAWRCIRRGRTHLLLTASASRDWRTPTQLAQMVASARPVG